MKTVMVPFALPRIIKPYDEKKKQQQHYNNIYFRFDFDQIKTYI
jgi:hypothetical protein